MKTTDTPTITRLPDLVPDAAAFVYNLFKEKLPEGIVFHSYQHTVDVANAAAKIGAKSDLSEEEQTLVALAAWFHDTGFTESYEQHEEASVRIATEYLERHDVPEEAIAQVAALIRATERNQQPQNRMEEVIRDADMAHLGKKKFFERAARLRQEWANMRGVEYTDQEWAEVQLAFLTSAHFSTPYARKQYEDRKQKNLKELRRMLAEFLDPAEDQPRKPADKKISSRGIETMYRTAYRNHITLSDIADSKANIMISVNAILLSILVSYVSTRLMTDPWLLIPAAALLITCLVAIIYAILSARPKVTNRPVTLEEVQRNEGNVLFFGNFVNMPLSDFRKAMHELMEDSDLLYDSMTRDLHSLGAVLSRKYRMLWISYSVFMGGLIVSTLLFLVFFFIG